MSRPLALAGLLMMLLVASCAMVSPPEGGIDDPIFDFDKIMHDPLDARVLTTVEAEGIVLQEIEYTADPWNGKVARIYGILAYPKGGKNLPGVFWSQGGMYRADDSWPKTFAKKGYFTLNITLPHDIYNSFARFTTEDARHGNLTGLAIAQMRGITYMTQRPEVDKDRIGVGGTSYGGLFSSLIAGADPRVKAGMSFFTTGNHHLGTGYPQFTQLRTSDEVGIWLGTIDPAWRLRQKKVPFLWAIAANDHWHYMPACVQTYKDSIGEKRMAIAPNWAHALPVNVDEMLIDWFDVYLTKTRKPYNQPGEITVENVDGKLIASWSWMGENPVEKAELVVSYGAVRPWHCWVYRYHYVIPAMIDGQSASAEIPVFEPGFELLAYGSITDERGVLTSTIPIAVRPDMLGIAEATAKKNFSTVLVTDFSPEEMVFLDRHATPVPGKPDTTEKQAGAQSLRVDDPKAVVSMKLGHVPEHDHRLTLWLKSDKPAKIQVKVVGAPPANWGSRVVDMLRREYEGAPDIDPEDIKLPVYTLDAEVDTQWREFALDCVFDGMPVEGYDLVISQGAGCDAVYWIDTIAFKPQWKTD